MRHPTSHSRLLRIDPLYAHTHSLQQGLSRCLGRAAGMPPQRLDRVGWMEFSPGEVEETEQRYIYPLKASCTLWLWLRDGCGSGFCFLRSRHTHSSIRLIKVRVIWVQVSGQILASRLHYLNQTLVKRESLSLSLKKRSRNPVLCQSDFALGDLTLGTLSSACEK